MQFKFCTNFLYGSETWAQKSKTAHKIQAAEMEFLGSVRRCIKLAKIRSEEIWKE
jgi:hypothetical protein